MFTALEGGRHARRIEKIAEQEKLKEEKKKEAEAAKANQPSKEVAAAEKIETVDS